MLHTHAPGWHGRPQTIGKVEDPTIEPRWLSLLWLAAVHGGAMVAAMLLIGGALTWAIA